MLLWVLQVDVRDTYQFTPLHSAANGGHARTIQKLIQFSHDVDVTDYLGACVKPATTILPASEFSSCLLRHRVCITSFDASATPQKQQKNHTTVLYTPGNNLARGSRGPDLNFADSC